MCHVRKRKGGLGSGNSRKKQITLRKNQHHSELWGRVGRWVWGPAVPSGDSKTKLASLSEGHMPAFM